MCRVSIPPPLVEKTSVKDAYGPAQAACAVWTAFLAVCAAVAPECVYAADTAWVEESISAHETGSWLQTVIYSRTTGLAPFNGGEHTYVPNAPSAGDYVTLNVRFSFIELSDGTPPDEDAQASIHIASNSMFQVWTKSGWLDVAAQGITPVSNVEYAVSFVLDYKAGMYSVAVQDSKGDWRRLRSASGGQTFPLAVKANALKAITFEGKTKFRSLKGFYTPERPAAEVFEPIGIRMGSAAEVFEPIGIRMGSATEVFEPVGIRMDSNDSHLSPSEFGWGQTNSHLSPSEFGWTQTTVVYARRNLDGLKRQSFEPAGIWMGSNDRLFTKNEKQEK